MSFPTPKNLQPQNENCFVAFLSNNLSKCISSPTYSTLMKLHKEREIMGSYLTSQLPAYQSEVKQGRKRIGFGKFPAKFKVFKISIDFYARKRKKTSMRFAQYVDIETKNLIPWQ